MAKIIKGETPNDEINKCIKTNRYSQFKSLLEVFMDRNNRMVLAAVLIMGGLMLGGLGVVSRQVAQVGVCGPVSALVTPTIVKPMPLGLGISEVSTPSATATIVKKKVPTTLPTGE